MDDPPALYSIFRQIVVKLDTCTQWLKCRLTWELPELQSNYSRAP